MDQSSVLMAFALTLFAGLSTGIGSALAFFTRRTNTRFLALALGFSAGVMIYVSFVEILSHAIDDLSLIMGERSGAWTAVASFFGGIAFIALIDRLVPAFENPHEPRHVEEMKPSVAHVHQLHRMGILAALAIGVHNLPEGLVTFAATLQDPALGLSIAVAVAIHNIPEGIAVAVPVYYATGSRGRAFAYSFLSGLSEPVGALIGFLLLRQFLNGPLFGIMFGAVAGIMVFISLDELLPSAREYGEHHLSMYGLIAGMGVMAISLLLFI